MESYRSYKIQQQMRAKAFEEFTAIPEPTFAISTNEEYEKNLPPAIRWTPELEQRVSEQLIKYNDIIEGQTQPELHAIVVRIRKEEAEKKKIEEQKQIEEAKRLEGKGKGFPEDTDDDDISLGAPTRPQEVTIQDRQLTELKLDIMQQMEIRTYTKKLEKNLYRWIRNQRIEKYKDTVAWNIRHLISAVESIPRVFGMFHAIAGRIEDRFYRFSEGKQSDIEQIQLLRKLTIWDFIEPYEYDHFEKPNEVYPL